MHLTCLQENLSHGLGVIQRAVATRTTLPITQHVLLATDQGRLKMSATNLEIAISTWVGAQIEEEGSVTVPARLLTDFVNSLDRQTLDISSLATGKGIQVNGDKMGANIMGADASEFPPIPTVDQGITAQIGTSNLRDAIHQVVFAAAVEDSRPVLTGVSLSFEQGRLVAAAADGFRLAVHTTTLETPVSEDLVVIVPGRTLQEVERLMDGDDPVDLVITSQRSQIMFRLKNTEIVSQLIQGTFPNYNQLIPQEKTTRVVVGLNDLMRATRTASIFAKDGSGIVRLTVSPGGESGEGTLTVSSRSEEVGDNTGEMLADVEGEEARIAFNSKYLSDVLSVIGKNKVALEMSTSSSPGVIRPVDDENYIHVVMPMFVQWGD
jgi:DNA polymerase-3 subunit beta